MVASTPKTSWFDGNLELVVYFSYLMVLVTWLKTVVVTISVEEDPAIIDFKKSLCHTLTFGGQRLLLQKKET